MSKRKKLRISGEGICPPKPPKHPRLSDSDGDPQSFQFGLLGHPEGRSGPVPSTEQSGEESGQEASSSLDREPAAPSRLFSQPEKEPIPFPPSQNSDRRFVPQFAKPRKTVTRLAAAKEEDLGSGALSLETPPEPSAQRAGSQSEQESLELTVLETWKPGDQTDGTHSEHSVQNSAAPVSSMEGSQPEVSSDISSESGMVPLVSESAGQDCLLEQGTNLPDAGSTEGYRIPGDLSQKGHLPSRGAEEEPDRGVPQEEGVQGETGTDQEKGDSVLGLVTQVSEPGSAAQAPPEPLQILSGVGREAGGSCSSPRHSSLSTNDLTDVVTDPTKSEQRALELTGSDEKAGTQAPASPSGKAPDGGHSGALLTTGLPLAVETTGSRGEARWEAEPPGDVSRSPAASLVLAHETQEPSIGVGYASPVVSEMGPVVGQTRVPDLDQEGLGGVCMLSVSSQPSGEKAAELGSQSHEQDLAEFSLSLGASVPLLHRETVVGPPRNAGAHQDSLDSPANLAGQPKHPDPADQAALELDFLPDSQIQDALEAFNFEAPPEQLFPAVSGVSPCWPDTSLSTEGGPLIESQPSTHKGIKPCEATRMEDATDTMRGLIIELSNLNRLIMNAHRDLEAFKRLNYRKAKPAGKAPMPHTSKGAGALPRGEHPWRDL